MDRKIIAPKEFKSQVFHDWEDKWFLLTAGNYKENNFNMMTVAWGGFGIMWRKPIAMIVVRPNRHTYGMIEDEETFTLSMLGEEHRAALRICGAKSGRDIDKVKETGLTPIASEIAVAPAFDEAKLILECKKVYFEDFAPNRFLDETIDGNYNNDYHRMYFGEILKIEGTEEFQI